MEPQLDPHSRAMFREALEALRDSELPFLVGGAFATNHHTGFWRNTKDLDVFCAPETAAAILDVLARAGWKTHIEDSHWLGKATRQRALVDVIWGGGNWATSVDEHWFRLACPGRIVDVPVLIAPAEDLILSKAWVADRERYDGHDITHLIRHQGHRFDWDDLVARFGDHWQLLLHYLILFRFCYPEQRDLVPVRIIRELTARIGTDDEIADGLKFRGPLVDRYGYLHDLRHDGLEDPRIEIARRAGFTDEDVRRRREADEEALQQGIPYAKMIAVVE